MLILVKNRLKIFKKDVIVVVFAVLQFWLRLHKIIEV